MLKINKNLNTEIATLQEEKLNLSGGIVECIKFENRLLFSKTPSLKNLNIIEFGCGIFPACFGLSNKSMPNIYIASDPSKKLINVAKSIDSRPLYKIFDLEKKLKIKGKKFDIIILKGVLHHLKYPQNALKKVSKILKYNGVIIVSEPNLSSIVANLMKWILKFFFKINMEASPYGQLKQSKIRSCFNKANLDIISEWYVSLIAFPLTGSHGRIPILPDKKIIFIILLAIEKQISKILNKFILLAKISHFKVNFIVKKRN